MNRANALKRVLRWLWEYHGAPKLDNVVSHYSCIRPRNVTATRDEIDTILDAAPAHMRLWLLLCSDLALRSSTAARIAPHHYNMDTREIRFTTKCDARLTLPVTDEIAAMFQRCDMGSTVSFVRQLWCAEHKGGGRRPKPFTNDISELRSQFRKHLSKLGITKRLIPHDLRRTAAVAMLEATGDIRDVQALLGHASLRSTIWYLDHDLRPVKKSTLELIKNPHWRKEKTA